MKRMIVEVDWPDMSIYIHRIINSFQGVAPVVELELFGKPCSKKNLYSPMANGKGFFKGNKIKNAEQMVSFQIPGEYRDLKLESPHILFQLKMPKKSWRMDRDNIWTFYQDALKNNGVILDDSTNRFNGYLIMAPVIESSCYSCKISIWRNHEFEC